MKNDRQKKILEIINNYDIDRQETLIEKLRDAGFNVTQTTVSRDINQLKLIKAVTATGRYKYIVPDVKTENNRTVMNSALTEAVISIVSAQNIVVVKTLSGMANALAVCIDSLEHEHIVGSVAGDDTILIVSQSNAEASLLEGHLKEVFNYR
jgi:transcriptional regulator of arginine metabolism